MVRKVAIYTRVSTLDQNVSNQLLELRDHCSKMGWEIVKEYADEGLSGTLSREKMTCTERIDQGCVSKTVR